MLWSQTEVNGFSTDNLIYFVFQPLSLNHTHTHTQPNYKVEEKWYRLPEQLPSQLLRVQLPLLIKTFSEECSYGVHKISVSGKLKGRSTLVSGGIIVQSIIFCVYSLLFYLINIFLPTLTDRSVHSALL